MTTALALAAPGPNLPQGPDLLPLESEWRTSLDLRVNAAELADSSRTIYLAGFTRFVDWCSGLNAVDADTILQWIAALRAEKFAPATINVWLAGVRDFFNWALSRGIIMYNPTAGLRGAKRKGSQKHKRDNLTDSEVLRVLAAPDPSTDAGLRDRAILHLMAYTAARTIEVYRADLADLGTESGRLVLKVQGKGREEADELIVIAHPEAEGAMRDWLGVRGREPGPLFTSLSNRSRHGRLSRSFMRRMVKGYFEGAGVTGGNKTTHSLRHSAITNAIRHRAPLHKAQAMARHSSIETTMIYVHEVDRIEEPAEDFIRYDD